MAIPDYQSFMKPILEMASDRSEHSIQDTYKTLADRMGLTEQDKAELLPSGRQETYKNRIGWARTYLSKAGLLENTRRASNRQEKPGRDA
jgi:restriction system protein